MKTQLKPIGLHIIIMFLMLYACNSDDDQNTTNTYTGNAITFGSGTVESWITTTNTDTPLELGLRLSLEALSDIEALPEDDLVFVVPLHDKASQVTAYEHITIQWEPAGHMPPVFLAPHFEIAFFEISNSERLTIPVYDANIPVIEAAVNDFPDVDKIPTGYIKFPGQGGYYPEAGKHWLTEDVLELTTFNTYIAHGTYDKKHIFLEAKFTMDYLQSLTQLNQTLAQPVIFEKSDTYYPTTLNARKSSESIEITLSNFIKR